MDWTRQGTAETKRLAQWLYYRHEEGLTFLAQGCSNSAGAQKSQLAFSHMVLSFRAMEYHLQKQIQVA